MPPIQTIATPVRNRISVPVPVEYRSYSFEVILKPIIPRDTKVAKRVRPARRRNRCVKSGSSFVEFMRTCPVDLATLDLSRDSDDGSSREVAFA